LWWSAFGVFAAAGVLWALATPLYAAPDEPSHVLRAAAIVRGDITGDSRAGVPSHAQVVDVPRSFVKLGANPFYADRRLYVPCYAFQPEVDASCFGHLPRSSGSVRAETAVGLDPPAFYGIVGLPSLLRTGATGIYSMRILSALAAAALLASALLSLRSVPCGRVAASGLAFAITPTAMFLWSTVNPNGLEIAAAIAAWASGGVLVVTAANGRVDPALVRRTGIAMIALVLARGLSPFWLALIVLVTLAGCSKATARVLIQSRAVRTWAIGVAGASVLAAAWILLANPLDHLYRHGPDPGDASTWSLIRQSFGTLDAQYRMMISVVGWVDTYPPAATYVLWTAGLGALVVLAVALAHRRGALLVVALVVLTIVVPIVVDVSQARSIGLGWQGRWTLPLAVGIPITAGLATATSRTGPMLERSRLPLALGACFAVAQFLAFAQALRRYTVGAHGPLDFWLHPRWTPPLPAWMLLGAEAVVIAALAALIWWPTPERFTVDAQ